MTVAIAELTGRALPDNFIESLQSATMQRFRRELRTVAGARDFIDAFADVPRCIASSSAPARLAVCLEVLDLQTRFGANVFSAEQVARGKPHPDIFLFAAEKMGAEPAHCIVIEDSVGGVQAALAAGMTAIGLTAASHIRDGHAERLRQAGAHHVAATFEEARDIVRRLLAR
jgi:HAD superfamily hydrolase (TIGR01509 family)